MAMSFSELRKGLKPADPKPEQPKLTLAGMSFDIDGFMSRNFPGVAPLPYDDGRKWILQICPWNAEHTNAAAFVIQRGSGVIQAGCHHNGCQNNNWRTLRAMYEPKRERQEQTNPPVKETPKPPPPQSTDLESHIEKIIRGEISNVAWEYSPSLTRLARCLIPGTITCLCGSSGSTKSMFISQECIGWLQAGTPFAVYHLEEDRTFHKHRALAQLSGEAKATDDKWIKSNPEAARDLMKNNKPVLDALGSAIWDAPASDVTLVDVMEWIKERANEGRRVIVVDPITVADSGREPWAADRRFILDAKRAMRDSGSSLVLVTHPRSDNKQAGTTMDNLAGGRAYNRFTQSVLWLESTDDQHLMVMVKGQLAPVQVTVNRLLNIRKARSGLGNNMTIAYYFDSSRLTFTEHGIVCKDEK